MTAKNILGAMMIGVVLLFIFSILAIAHGLIKTAIITSVALLLTGLLFKGLDLLCDYN